MTTAAQHDAFPDTPDTDPGLGGHNAGREPGVIKRAGQRIGQTVTNFVNGLDLNMLAVSRSPYDYHLPRAVLPEAQPFTQPGEAQVQPQPEDTQPPATV